MAATPTCDFLLSDCASTLIRIRARQLCRRPGFCQTDYDDLRQEIFLYLLRRIDHFDPQRGSPAAFIHYLVQCSISKILRRRRSARRTGELRALSINRTTFHIDGRVVPAREAISEDDLQRRTGARRLSANEQYEQSEAIAHAYRALSMSERDVWRHLTCRTPAAAARQMATSRRRIRNAMAAIRYQLEVAGLKHF